MLQRLVPVTSSPATGLRATTWKSNFELASLQLPSKMADSVSVVTSVPWPNVPEEYELADVIGALLSFF